MPAWAWITVGAVVGANCRYYLGLWVANRWGSSFPYGTMIINIMGSLLIGIVLTLLTERFTAAPAWRLTLVVGFLGAYTTFSSFSYETLRLAELGNWLDALKNILGHGALGLLAVWLGARLARLL